MLHEAIFLATCNATMTNKKPLKLQRGCHTFATYFATCNAYNSKQDGGNLPWAKDESWLVHSDKIALQVAEGMLHASNLSRNVAKSRGSFYFSCNSQRNNCSCKLGCYTCIFSLIVSCNALFAALQVAKKVASCNMAFTFLHHSMEVKVMQFAGRLWPNTNKTWNIYTSKRQDKLDLKFKLLFKSYEKKRNFCVVCTLPKRQILQ